MFPVQDSSAYKQRCISVRALKQLILQVLGDMLSSLDSHRFALVLLDAQIGPWHISSHVEKEKLTQTCTIFCRHGSSFAVGDQHGRLFC